MSDAKFEDWGQPLINKIKQKAVWVERWGKHGEFDKKQGGVFKTSEKFSAKLKEMEIEKDQVVEGKVCVHSSGQRREKQHPCFFCNNGVENMMARISNDTFAYVCMRCAKRRGLERVEEEKAVF